MCVCTISLNIINVAVRTLMLRISATKIYIYFVKSLEYVSSSRNAILMVTMVMCTTASFFEGKKLATPARIPLGIAGMDNWMFKALKLDLINVHT